MQFTDEEMNVLNRACEILSKHAACGELPREHLTLFEKMMITVIDEAKDIDCIDEKEAKRGACATDGVSTSEITKTTGNASTNSAKTTGLSLLPMDGTYSEQLRSGGKLEVSKHGWSISYYFPGLDRRYKGTIVTIRGDEIDQYITAWKTNLKTYTELKRNSSPDDSFSISGAMGMTINIGGFFDGVALRLYNMIVRNDQDVNRIITDYEYARTRANQLMHGDVSTVSPAKEASSWVSLDNAGSDKCKRFLLSPYSSISSIAEQRVISLLQKTCKTWQQTEKKQFIITTDHQLFINRKQGEHIVFTRNLQSEYIINPL